MFKTSETTLAAYLMISGCSLLSLDRQNPNRIYFVFEDTIKLRGVVDEYHNGSPVGNILEYDIARRTLIKKIHEEA